MTNKQFKRAIYFVSFYFLLIIAWGGILKKFANVELFELFEAYIPILIVLPLPLVALKFQQRNRYLEYMKSYMEKLAKIYSGIDDFIYSINKLDIRKEEEIPLIINGFNDLLALGRTFFSSEPSGKGVLDKTSEMRKLFVEITRKEEEKLKLLTQADIIFDLYMEIASDINSELFLDI